MVNPRIVNTDFCIFRRRIFANLFPLWADFYDSKIRLNIRASLILTNITPSKLRLQL